MPISLSTRVRRGMVAFAVLLSSVAFVSVVAPAAEGAANQITVFKHTGSQTKSKYFSPTLNQPSDYTRPADFSNGRVFVKLDVLSKPSNRSIIPQLCFWRHTATQKFKFETCAITRKFAFTDEGTVWIDAGNPANWYKKNGTWDWSKQASLGRIMLKDELTGKLLLTSSCGGACYRGNDIDKHVPVRMTAEVIFVAEGSQLAPPNNWRSQCPAAWSSQCRGSGPAPTPRPTPRPTPTATPTPGPTPPGPTVTPSPTPRPKPAPKPTPPPGNADPDITVAAGNGKLVVRWSAVSGVKSWQFRFEGDRGGWKWDPPTTTRVRTVTGLSNGQPYRFQIRALVRGEWQAWIGGEGTPRGGSSEPPTPPPPPPAADIGAPAAGNGKDVAVIVGRALQAKDKRYIDTLVGFGYDVTILTAAGLIPNDLKNIEAAIITSAVKPDDVPKWLADSKVPLLVSEAFVMDDLGMATRPKESGSVKSLDFVTKHVATSRVLGPVELGKNGTKYIHSAPGDSASVLAEHTNGDAAIYLYFRGQQMVDRKAPARRIGWFMSNDSPLTANQNAWNLLGHAVAWLTK